MSSDLYALIALAARYWFVALIIVILFRGWRMTVADNRRAKLLREWMGQTGCVGELIANPGAKRHVSYPIPREGVLGASRNADVRIRHRDMKRAHAHFELREGGLLIKPLGRAELSVGSGFTGGAVFLQDGDVMTIGRLQLKLVLFDAPIEEEPEDEWFEAGSFGALPEDEDAPAADDWFDEEHGYTPRRLREEGARVGGKTASRRAAKKTTDPREAQARKPAVLRAQQNPVSMEGQFSPPPAAYAKRRKAPIAELPFDTEPAPRHERDLPAGNERIPGKRAASGAQRGPNRTRAKRAVSDDDLFDEDTIWRDR